MSHCKAVEELGNGTSLRRTNGLRCFSLHFMKLKKVDALKPAKCLTTVYLLLLPLI